MPTVQQLIQYLRQNNHTTSNSTITARDLAAHFNISDGGTEVPMRAVIRDAIAQNSLIGSNNHGYYLIGTLVELEDNIDSLQGRAEGDLQRRRNMMQSWNNQNPANQTTKTDLFVLPKL